jgi:hypothetical protein
VIHRVGIPLATVGLALALALAGWLSRPTVTPVALQPSLTGQTEYCLTCHQGIEEISAAHPTAVFGCVRCHGGEPLALDADLAHSTLRGGANPSDLAVAAANCGGSECHTGAAADQRDHIARVTTSLQATYAGAIANIYYAFGGQPDLTPRYAISAVAALDPSSQPLALAALSDALPAASPMLAKFQANCLTCHLSASAADQTGYRRLTGCAACHSLTNAQGTYTGSDPTLARDETGHAQAHRLTTAIPYTQCNACHNRGNYDLRTMTFTPRADQPLDRLHDYYQPIAQCTLCEYELDCVDCHTAGEAMGDGALHPTQASSQSIECRTCHGTLTAPPLTRTLTDPNDVALRRAALNPAVPLALGDTIVFTALGEPLWSVQRLPSGAFQQVSKVDGLTYPVPLVQGSQCLQNPDEQASAYCHACHAVQR